MFSELLISFADKILFLSCILILIGCVFISFKFRFIQLRFFSNILNMLKSSKNGRNNAQVEQSISPQKALLTAMSTTLGISTIVAPVIAMHMGGPGALLGFLLTSFFGSAATYAEVRLSIQHRKRLENGVIMGGPMQYLKTLFNPFMAKWYAVCCLVLMTAWSGAQASQIAAILSSPLFGDFQIPALYSGAVIALFSLGMLFGGIKRIGNFSAYLVPVMFTLYLGSSLWIILANVDRMGEIFSLIVRSAFSPQPMMSGIFVGGLVSALRWGVFKGIQCCEAGIGTQTIPHSMAQTEDAKAQASLAMLSTYTAGIVAFMSGVVSLLTNTWQDASLPLGISMVAASFEMYFSSFGLMIIAITTFLFAFGTILGNCFNGSQCFAYLTNNKKLHYYFIFSACGVFVGAISDVKTFWSFIDIILACAALPHVAALVLYARQEARKPVISPAS